MEEQKQEQGQGQELRCYICDKVIIGEYIQASVDKNLQRTEDGVIVCSRECAAKYEETLPRKGKPMDQFSRITGYYQKIEGWNVGKLQELKDRKKYGIR